MWMLSTRLRRLVSSPNLVEILAPRAPRQTGGGTLEHAAENFELTRHQVAGHGGQPVGDPLRRRVRAMRRAKGVVDEHIGERRQAPGQSRVVALLPRLEAHVLEHGDAAVVQRVDRRLRRLTDHIAGHRNLHTEQLTEPVGQGNHAQRTVDMSPGTAQVGHDDGARAAPRSAR